jgi:hypothetical protein
MLNKKKGRIFGPDRYGCQRLVKSSSRSLCNLIRRGCHPMLEMIGVQKKVGVGAIHRGQNSLAVGIS